VQVPALHTSVVQALSSSVQALVLFACWQPVVVLQLSVVQVLLSSQLSVMCWQPVVALQLSVVQASLSSQLTVVCWQPVVVPQVSVVQALLSSQLSVECWQPNVGSQASAVQVLLSLQSRGVPPWQPRLALQNSAPLQTWPSSQAALFA
jgi:hypothetical protein